LLKIKRLKTRGMTVGEIKEILKNLDKRRCLRSRDVDVQEVLQDY
jgi:DNA-binding transcriptional MerR regulator